AIAARRSRVANGGVGGGRVLGYRNVGEAKTKRREVDPAQAALVVRLFEMRAKGLGYVKTAKMLNAENIPNPTGQDRLGRRKRVSGMWSPTGIRAVVNNRIYLGEIIDGNTQNERLAGRRIRVAGARPRVERGGETPRLVREEPWPQGDNPVGRGQGK